MRILLFMLFSLSFLVVNAASAGPTITQPALDAYKNEISPLYTRYANKATEYANAAFKQNLRNKIQSGAKIGRHTIHDNLLSFDQIYFKLVYVGDTNVTLPGAPSIVKTKKNTIKVDLPGDSPSSWSVSANSVLLNVWVEHFTVTYEPTGNPLDPFRKVTKSEGSIELPPIYADISIENISVSHHLFFRGLPSGRIAYDELGTPQVFLFPKIGLPNIDVNVFGLNLTIANDVKAAIESKLQSAIDPAFDMTTEIMAGIYSEAYQQAAVLATNLSGLAGAESITFSDDSLFDPKGPTRLLERTGNRRDMEEIVMNIDNKIIVQNMNPMPTPEQLSDPALNQGLNPGLASVVYRTVVPGNPVEDNSAYTSWEEEYAAGGAQNSDATGAPKTNGVTPNANNTAIWTGMYLGSLAYRYSVRQDNIDAIDKTLRGIEALFAYYQNPTELKVDGLVVGTVPAAPGMIPRAAAPKNSPLGQSIYPGDSHPCDTCRSREYQFTYTDRQGVQYTETWVAKAGSANSDGITRDQFTGVLFGLRAVYDLVDDQDIKDRAKYLVQLMIDRLIADDWGLVVDRNAPELVTTAMHAKVVWLTIGNHVTGGRYEQELTDAWLIGDIMWLGTAATALNPLDKYFGYNLFYTNMMSFFAIEKDPARRAKMMESVRIADYYIGHHNNGWFDLVRASYTDDPVQKAAYYIRAEELLKELLKGGHRLLPPDYVNDYNVFVDPVNMVTVDYPLSRDVEITSTIIPPQLRQDEEFAWERHPYQTRIVNAYARSESTGLYEPKNDVINYEQVGQDITLLYWALKANGYVIPDPPTIPPGDLSGGIAESSILDGAYYVTADVTVPVGNTLTVKAGSVLTFAPGTRLTINGSINIDGTLSQQVLLQGASAYPYPGEWKGIVLSPGAQAAVTGATIMHAEKSIVIDGAWLQLSDSTLREHKFVAVDFLNGGGGEVLRNTIDNLQRSGTGINMVDASANVNGYGIWMAENHIANQIYGVYIGNNSAPLIRHDNDITANGYGVYISFAKATPSAPVLVGNRIYGNVYYNMFARVGWTGTKPLIDATNNYWGTEDIPTITAGVYDSVDSAYYGLDVDFVPFLDATGASSIGTAFTGVSGTSTRTLAAGSVWDVVEPTAVTTSAELIVESGAMIRFHGPRARLEVDGRLDIAGTESSPVYLTSGKSTWKQPGDWPGITLTANSTASISNAVIEYNVDGIVVDGAWLELRNSRVKDHSTNGVKFTNGGGGIVDANTITNASRRGSGIYMQDANIGAKGYSLSITGNTIDNHLYGLDVWPRSAPVITGGNVITANLTGVRLYGNNYLTQAPAPVVNGNSIYGNSSYNVYIVGFGYLANSTSVDFSGNWWGTEDLPAIASTIYDAVDGSASAAYVDYLPFLDASGLTTTGTALSGNIASQILDPNSAWDVVNEVIIGSNDAVSVGEGTTFRFHGPRAKLVIEGEFRVNGTSAAPVAFTSVNVWPKKGDWGGIVVSDPGAAYLDYVDVEYAVSGIAVEGGWLVLSNSLLTNQSMNALTFTTGGGGVVSNNTFDNINRSGNGILLQDATQSIKGYSLAITGNDIQNFFTGIGVEANSSPQVQGANLITNNWYGVRIMGNNAVADNPSPVINGNSIYGNNSYNYFANSFGNAAAVILDATGNWWGTDVTADIEASIYDHNDYYSAPVVDIAPFLLTAP